MSDVSGWKVLTHDYRPPVQGGEAVWDGQTLPYELPKRRLDHSLAECAPGWHFSREPEDALILSGLWPDGWPSVLVRVETVGDWVERGETCRAASLRITEVASDRTLERAIRRMTRRKLAGTPELVDRLAREQLAWHRALGRPQWDPDRVERGLRRALEARGLGDWQLRQYRSAMLVVLSRRAAMDRDCEGTWNADSRWHAWDIPVDYEDRWPWYPRPSFVSVADYLSGSTARQALQLWLSTRGHPARLRPDALTVGIRDAYTAGLAVAMPTASGRLGWAMVEQR